ncbi:MULTISPECIES: ferritin-like domain-containing protein [unclassified Deinococcus]|uniref:ferritin-like domain-containing protein n=1 Tax=unclassified Deinococcus TaxID=2623546 RepID=UPI001E631CE2|nr:MULTISPECIES: ferritin-like domain-containing protein [unclassified Deinococcus]MCD0163300.1 ferritin-like domain-containing protein [Deinococcus sp. 6YEL10]MCD0168302.1 ferritin-like domain-containing protein [Deinococcus sp. 23YEL01]
MTTPNRRSFLKFAGAGAGAMTLGGLSLPALAATSVSTKSAAQDLVILNYALTLEYLEAEFYNAFTGSGAYASRLVNPRVREYARELADHENIHVKALQDTIRSLNGTPVAKPNIDFSPLLTNSDGTAKTVNDELFLALANTFEPIGVRAYLGQADKIMNGDVLTAAASILAVEANHASGIQELRTQLNLNKKPTRQTSRAPQSDAKPTSTNVADFDGDFSPTPTDFWAPLSMDEVLAIVKPLIKS